jgi:hypothetical protein
MIVPSRIPALGLLLSTGLSQLGNAVVAVVLPWLVLQRTGSASWAGVVAAASLVTGPLVDLIGVPATLLVLSAGCLMATAFAARAPGLRSIEAVTESSSEPSPPVPTAAGQPFLGA